MNVARRLSVDVPLEEHGSHPQEHGEESGRDPEDDQDDEHAGKDSGSGGAGEHAVLRGL